MPIDASIALGIKPPQIESPMNAMTQALQVQGLQNQNSLASYSLNKAQRGDADLNALMQHLANGGNLATPEGQAAAFRVAPLSAPAMIKQQLEQGKLVADTGKANAGAAKDVSEAAHKKLSMFREVLDGVNSPQDAAQWLQAQYADPQIAPLMAAKGPFEQAVQRIPTDPAGFAQWKQQAALGMTKFVEMNKPNIQVRNTGGSTDVLAVPGLGGPAQVVSSVRNTQSPDSIASNATSRANNANTIAAENLRAGVTPGGELDDNAERTAQAIASGQLPAPTGMALLNPKNQRILGRVMEINPQYDSTTVTAKRAAATAFTSGPLGNALRSVSTANAHLDQLGELADALNNGNTQVVNKVQNYFSKATGNPAVTNFDAIKAIVGQEVVKAIVAGGGGVGEREEAAKIFSSANSPAQLKGAIQHYRMVMGAQANNLMEQRRAAGLPDSTLPNYSATNPSGGGAPAAPAGWKIEKVN